MKVKYFILLLCFVGDLSDAQNDETSGNTHPFKKIGGKYYIVFTGAKMNWFAAAHLCQTYNSDLATIDSETELNDLNFYLTSNGQIGKFFWFGGTDLAEEGRYVSLSTGRPMIYTKFAAGQPDNYQEEDCLHLQAFNNIFYMNDYPCTGDGYPICEMRRMSKTCAQDTCEDISTSCALKTLVQAYLRAENTFSCRE
ncbi:C-type lectin 37Db isoform X2 [Bactrocera dorsalis]|uniref:C-type lectin 37Db isoform X2 n=1 Tax=Bactrocera dorsalis TaxID=27457 RepID=A0A9B2LD32_BACDO|nr:C-type lectin 37Db isoform X2 [Bactrocera dorsalis]